MKLVHYSGALTLENLSSGDLQTKKGTDQPAHPCRLISAFIIGILESIMYQDLL